MLSNIGYKSSDCQKDHFAEVMRMQILMALLILIFSATGAWANQEWSLSDWGGAWEAPPKSIAANNGAIRLAYWGNDGLRVVVFPGSDSEPGFLETKPLPVVKGAIYEFQFELLRPKFVNGHYISVKMFGEDHLLDQHCMAGGWQVFYIREKFKAGSVPRISIRNDYPSTFLLRNPTLRILTEGKINSGTFHGPSSKRPKRFPIGVYGGTPEEWQQIAACGFNLVVTGINVENAGKQLNGAAAMGLTVIPHLSSNIENFKDWERVLNVQPKNERPPLFYVEDEPELRSVEPAKLDKLRYKIKEVAPWCGTATAMVRPKLVSRYSGVYDAIFMDQYPVPNQPMNWLADSVREAKKLLPSHIQVWSVVQAFNSPKDGWPRLPTFEEMQVLALSSMAEGSDGILFFVWRQIRDNPEHLSNVRRVLSILNKFESWFPLKPGLGPGLLLQPIGRVVSTPSGSIAVRAGYKVEGKQRLIILVNQTRYAASYKIRGFPKMPIKVENQLTGDIKIAVAGEMRDSLEPLGVRVWIYKE